MGVCCNVHSIQNSSYEENLIYFFSHLKINTMNIKEIMKVVDSSCTEILNRKKINKNDTSSNSELEFDKEGLNSNLELKIHQNRKDINKVLTQNNFLYLVQIFFKTNEEITIKTVSYLNRWFSKININSRFIFFKIVFALMGNFSINSSEKIEKSSNEFSILKSLFLELKLIFEDISVDVCNSSNYLDKIKYEYLQSKTLISFLIEYIKGFTIYTVDSFISNSENNSGEYNDYYKNKWNDNNLMIYIKKRFNIENNSTYINIEEFLLNYTHILCNREIIIKNL